MSEKSNTMTTPIRIYFHYAFVLLLLAQMHFFPGKEIHGQSCLPDGIAFYSQTKIDSFPIAYSGCTEILGNVKIAGSSITNLHGLAGVTVIHGLLTISGCKQLPDLSGLDSLVYIGGLDFGGNTLLTGMMGLGSLKTIDGNIMIIGNCFHDLRGLNSLSYIKGSLFICNSDYLYHLTGLEHLKTVGGDICMYNLPNLADMTGLDSLTTIGRSLQINDNYPGLKTLEGLDKVQTIGESLRIFANMSLTDISSLKNLDPSSINFLEIYFNYSLSECSIKSICELLTLPDIDVTISGNATGCHSRKAVSDACELSVPEEDTTIHWKLFPNPCMDRIIIETSCPDKNGKIILTDVHSRFLLERNVDRQKYELDLRMYKPGIYFLRIESLTNLSVFKIVKM